MTSVRASKSSSLRVPSLLLALSLPWLAAGIATTVHAAPESSLVQGQGGSSAATSGQNMTLEQYRAYLQQRYYEQLQAQAQSQGVNLSPAQQQQLSEQALTYANQHIQAQQQAQQAQQSQQAQQAQPGQAAAAAPGQNMTIEQYRAYLQQRYYEQLQAQAQSQGVNLSPAQQQQLREQALAYANQHIQQQQAQQQAQQQQAQQQALAQQQTQQAAQRQAEAQRIAAEARADEVRRAQIQAQQQAQLLAQDNASGSALSGNTNARGTNYSIDERWGTMSIPAPHSGINYGANVRHNNQGNALVELPPAFVPKFGANGEATGVDEGAAADPLASPFYDGITGKVDEAKQKQAEIAAKLRAINSPTEQVEEKYVDPVEQRLAQYDRELAEKRLNDPTYQAFGDFSHHDRVFKQIAADQKSFYLDRPQDQQVMQQLIAQIEKNSSGELGFVLMDEKGIIALKDNTPFPLDGLSEFHLAYAVGALMSDRGENKEQTVNFDTNTIVRDIRSPLADTLFASLKREVVDATGQVISDPNSNTNRISRSQRGKIIANVIKQEQQGKSSANMDEVRLQSQPKKDLARYSEEMSSLQDGSKRMSLSMGELFSYSLGMSDPNANMILLQYLGTLTSLEIFDRTKGVEQAVFKKDSIDIAIDPQDSLQNNAPLYDSAKLLAQYAQDIRLTEPVRSLIDQIMYFNVTSKEKIQKGVMNSLKSDDASADRNSFQIYTKNGMGVLSPDKKSISVLSDMALIKYRGKMYIMVIAVRNASGKTDSAIRFANNAIAFTSKVLFDYVKNRAPHDRNALYQPRSLKINLNEEL